MVVPYKLTLLSHQGYQKYHPSQQFSKMFIFIYPTTATCFGPYRPSSSGIYNWLLEVITPTMDPLFYVLYVLLSYDFYNSLLPILLLSILTQILYLYCDHTTASTRQIRNHHLKKERKKWNYKNNSEERITSKIALGNTTARQKIASYNCVSVPKEQINTLHYSTLRAKAEKRKIFKRKNYVQYFIF
jgi:hypothetical protein